LSADAPPPEWQYVGPSWPREAAGVTGWDHPSVGAVMLDVLPEFGRVVTGTQPLGIYPLAPDAYSESGHNVSMTFGYVLARAAYGRERLSVLDWGGGLGHYALMARHLMPELPLDVTVKERPELCRIGRDLMPWVTFEASDEACFARRYDLVIASTSLQYVEHWRRLLDDLARAAAGWLFVTRLPVVRLAPSFVVVQRPYALGYQTEFLAWAINRDELLAGTRTAGLTLQREFIAGAPIGYVDAPEVAQTVGFLFKR
jgi:putative methyltransferase (TIGR04325 family)